MKAVKAQTNQSDQRQRLRRLRAVNPLSPPTTLELAGVRIHFPFKPYACQVDYMRTALQALQRSEHALLESPTGTGKTLCLLCSALAWQRQQARAAQQEDEQRVGQQSSQFAQAVTVADEIKRDVEAEQRRRRAPVIIYASRTHSQISQVVRELRNTRYRPVHAVLGSREQFCVNPKVSKKNATSSEMNHDCNKLCKDRRCSYRNRLEQTPNPFHEEGSTQQPVLDLEDLVSQGKEQNVCPFYYTRGLVEKAELILLPYNYLFDKDARQTTLAEIPWDNAVVIFDEAHNLESFASESASFDLSNVDIAGCVKEIQKVLNYVDATPDAFTHIKKDNLSKLKEILLQLDTHLINLGDQTAYAGEFMMDFFQRGASITHANHEIFVEEIRKVNDALMDLRGGSNRGSPRLEHFVQCLKRVFGYTMESRCFAKSTFYRVHVSPKQQQPNGADQARTISYWCFAPALAMQELASLKVRSILVTSGTLSPLPSYSMELGLHFPHQLENPHIIDDEQIYVRVVSKGPTGKLLSSAYERRKDGEYYTELGNTLVNFARIVPDGVLVFFPSYGVMETCLERWGGPAGHRKSYDNRNQFFAPRRQQSAAANKFSFPHVPSFSNTMSSHSTPWKGLLALKSIVVEPKSSTDLPEAMNDFRSFVSKKPGCILMGVCRGKISEGIDFAGAQSRAVIVTGLPFPPAFDAKVKLKREYLDGARAQNKVKATGDGGFGGNRGVVSSKLSGHEWYTQQAHRAVNQALGRVIRNRSDYGAVLLLDARFSQPYNQAGLSKWLRPHMQKDECFGSTVSSLTAFFKSAEGHTAKKAEAERRAAAVASPAVLEYEEEEEEIPSRVALIKKPNTADRSASDEQKQDEDSPSRDENSTYLPPNRVVARVDVKQLQKSTTCTEMESPIQTRSEEPRSVASTNDALFATSKPSKPEADTTKQLALKFMDKAKAKLSVTEQSAIRKSIVAMKKFGEKKDVRSYVKSAASVVAVVIGCEKFECHRDASEERMLFLFFGLLPKAYKKNVEVMSFEMVFDKSSLGKLCKENFFDTEQRKARKSMGRLMQTLWCRKSDIPLPTEEYFRRCRGLLEDLHKAGSSSLVMSAYCKLIPECFQNATRALFADIVASRNIAKLKGADKLNLGENSVDASRFIVASPKRIAQATEPLKQRERPGIMEEAAGLSSKLKRKQPESQAVSSIQNCLMPRNPYSRKKQPFVTKTAAMKPKLPPAKPAANSLATYLKTIESETFVKRSAKDIVKDIKATAPKDIVCSVCSIASKEPFVADCGHMACLSCWKSWFQRSQTCMTCRAATTVKSLARVVYEPGSGDPQRVSQKLADTEEGVSEDEELEIM